ncbi:c-type cytochrome [Azospirillum sp. TSO22-1]|uniref:c-type cytochrome n=1 Tax=Azospirillum sp. TSO22-1 TaxID=716789 RepID=UPI000D6209F2|nr:c-type cytochrome [Azospirillum sp. TSO22-1]PWC41906.1 hypothetical protein TSO221_22750 [Azospirillum sp. TSO22-1]
MTAIGAGGRVIGGWLSTLVLLLASGAGAEPTDNRPDAKAYSIADGRVDRRTYDGYRRYHAVCSHCHGPDGLGGAFAPSLVDPPLAPEAFRDATLAGRVNGRSVMRGFADDPNVANHVDAIFAYLQARADGAIGRGRPQPSD